MYVCWTKRWTKRVVWCGCPGNNNVRRWFVDGWPRLIDEADLFPPISVRE